MLLISVFVITV